MKTEIQPDGIIITISAGMIKEKGYRNWLRNFLHAMGQDDWTYWMKQGARPKQEILYVYLCIGNKIRYRANFVMSEGPCEKTFEHVTGTTTMFSRAWIVLSGPVVRPEYPFPMKGFRGFRYTEKLF